MTTDGTWQQLIRNKYLNVKTLSQAFWKSGDSHFWARLMKVKHDFWRFGTFTIRNGSQVRFVEDIWLGTSTLRDQYPCLYHIARYKHVSVADVFNTLPLVLSNDQDGFRWNLSPDGQFSVKSHYLGLIHLDVPNLNKNLWKLKAPIKIKIFLWFL